ncbi:MAG: carbohydrate ABC transporter permease [Bacilli bacterium]
MNKQLKLSRIKKMGPLMSLLLALLILYTLILFFPLFWGILESLMDGTKVESTLIPWPSDWKFTNYLEAFRYFYVPVESENGTLYPTLTYMFVYSLIYAVGSAFMATFIPCLVAYLTARFDYTLSKIINVFVIIAIALPIVGSLPSEIQMARNLGLYDKIYGIWIMKGHFISIYYLIFHARFKTFPKSFEEAASIDGAGHFRILFQIMLPMVKNLFWTVFLLQFIQFWNDYYTPLVYMPSYPTLAYGMWYYNNSRENVLTNIPMKITGCILMLIPVLIIFSIFGKRLMVNLIEGGDKET